MKILQMVQNSEGNGGQKLVKSLPGRHWHRVDGDRLISKKQDRQTWTGLNWLRLATGGRLL